MSLIGALAQLGARHIRIVEAVGSNPICSRRTSKLILRVSRFFTGYS